MLNKLFSVDESITIFNRKNILVCNQEKKFIYILKIVSADIYISWNNTPTIINLT